MKILIASVLCLFCVLAIGAPASASTWSQFEQVESRYYRLDTQPVSAISCHIAVPLLTKVVAVLRARLAGKIAVTDSLDSYAIFFRKSSGVQISDPQINFRLVDKAKLTDPARLELAEKQIRENVEGQVEGIDNMIRALFDDYETPTPNKYKVRSVSKRGDTYTLRYRYEGSDVVEVISGDKVRNETDHGGAQTSAHSDYEPTSSGKIIFHSAVMHAVTPDVTVDSIIKVSYQQFGGVLFPSAMVTTETISTQGQARRGNVNIQFTHCRTQK